jgi:hypothetical protein
MLAGPEDGHREFGPKPLKLEVDGVWGSFEGPAAGIRGTDP